MNVFSKPAAPAVLIDDVPANALPEPLKAGARGRLRRMIPVNRQASMTPLSSLVTNGDSANGVHMVPKASFSSA